MNSAPDGIPATVRLWSLSEDALVEDRAGQDSLLVVSRWGEQTVTGVDAATTGFLRRMALGPVSRANASPGHDGQARLDRVLDELSGVVVHSLALPDGQAPLISARPVVPVPAFRVRAVPADAYLLLDRFAVMGRREGGLMLQMPGAPFLVQLIHPLAGHVAASLGSPCTVAGLSSTCALPVAVVADMAAFLLAAGVLLLGDPDGRFAEDDRPELDNWTQHELLFHMRSRSRWRDRPADADARPDRTALSPLTRPLPEGPRFPLHQPRVETLEAKDPTLTRLLEDDHVCPHFSDEEIPGDQLGELLFRSARIRSIGPTYLPVNVLLETSQRPYFSIACMYELELYLTVNRCTDLPRAIYHYDPLGHALTMIDAEQAAVDSLLDVAKVAAGSRTAPAVLITITARQGRTSWIFDGAAYSTALMHAGTLQQTLYLSAKTMGLSAHAVTVDASDTVDRVLKLNWPSEVAIGECVVDSHC